MMAVKIAIGSSVAIFIAKSLKLEFYASAGTITLLTLMATKWETVRLSLWRIVTFALSAVLAGVFFAHMHSEWLAFGIYIFLIVFISDFLGWRTTISANAVAGTHFLQLEEFSLHAVWNEFQLILIGIFIAIMLNQFHGNNGRKKDLARGMRETETNLQMALTKIAGYLKSEPLTEDTHVWADLTKLKSSIQVLIQDAYEYQENTFQNMGYYYDYLRMRLEQCNILINLHSELMRMRAMPVQSLLIADYVTYMAEFVVEINKPERQIQRLREIFLEMQNEPLPATREEFESRAILYHVLMDLEDFLKCKEQFVNSLNNEQL